MGFLAPIAGIAGKALLGAGISAGVNKLVGGSPEQRAASAQQDAINQQLQAAREQNSTQRAIAQAQLDFQNKLLRESQAYNYPRQSAANRSLGQASAMLGLGNIFAAPVEGGLGGGPQFYPGSPGGDPGISTPQIGGGAAGQADPRAQWSAYVQEHPDLLAEYNAFASRPGGYAFGPNLPRTWDRNGDNYIDMDEYGEFHWNKWGQNESNRTAPEDLFY